MVVIIAEAGVNHNGDINLAKQLIDVAASAGADYVKFQTFKAEKIASASAQKAQYQKEHTGEAESQLEMLKRLELTEADHRELIEYCKSRNIEFLSTAFDEGSIDLLRSLNIKLGKIPSGEITNLPYLRKMARSFPELILSTGMCDLQDIENALNILFREGVKKDQVTVLHCNTEYPTPFADVNLLAMNGIRERFGVKVGYSDHTIGIEVPIAAVALGAAIIEKHFTLDRNLKGPDHEASLEPSELIEMVKSIRNIERAIGTSVKAVSASEAKNKVVVRKSIVAAREIEKGEIFSEANLSVKRPGNGISPMEWDNIIGKTAKRKFATDELIEI